ncbi:hypothetical protein HYALB_00011972 [Hymenoscyphus albidus]|uniref:Cytochrome P450 n=1 Tax=Hymenoscyphus albidus TaxID=595503 RepID=A0A9N9LHV0_9HELO|nr:hypothetical protein HYALB_00011972 [Hymenoscyphus albidus]
MNTMSKFDPLDLCNHFQESSGTALLLHSIRRVVLTPAFSPARVQELAPMVKENVDLLLKRFEGFAKNGSPVNIFTSTKAFTMDIISKIVFGKELGCIEDPAFRNQFIEYLHGTFEMGWPATTFPNLTRLSLSLPDWIADRLFPIPLMEFKKKCIKLIENYLNDRNVPIVEKTGKQAKKNEFNQSVVIDTLVDPSTAKDHSVLNASELAEEVIMLLSAGNDTTSNAMISGIYQILRSPEVYKRLNEELMVNFPMLENEITYDRAKTLPYLSAVIKEILRYSSPLPARLPRVVPPEGYNLYGHHVPPSTIMVTSSYLLNRHESCWPNPDQFSPERWLNNDSARLDKYMTSFYRGTRQCLGKE